MKILFFLGLIGIFILSVLPSNELPEVAHISDKFNHIIAYVFLMGGYVYIWKEKFLKGALLLFLYSLFIEGVQHFLPTRYFGLDDLVANGLGIILGLYVGKYIEKRFSTKN